MSKRETSAEIDAAAADWAVRIDGAPFDESLQRTLEAWTSQDQRRLGAYARARAVLNHSKRIRALGPNFEPDAFAEAAPVRAGAVPHSRRRVLAFGGLGAIAAGAGALAFALEAAAETFHTGRGEIRLIPLKDGSSVTLNTLSSIRVRSAAGRHCVDMLSGEALFDAVKGPQGPLEIFAGDNCMRAAGASFTIAKLQPDTVEVMVRRGDVEVESRRTATDRRRRLPANTRVAFLRDRPVRQEILTPAQIARQLAWREGMLSFEDQPLASAAREFERYSGVRIRFADPQIAAETVTGLYAANNPAGFAQAVAVSLDLRMQRTSDGVVLTR